MKRLQIVDHNINIGHCKVYSTDFVTNNLWFIKLLNSEFRILMSEFRIPNSEFRILNSEFRISKKKLFIEILFLGMPHQGPCTGWGLLISNWNNSNNSIVKYMSFY